MPEKQNLVRQLRKIIDDFLAARLATKTEKLAPDDPARENWEEKFSRPVWIADAARRVSWIQAATHTIKAIHPGAKGSNLFCPSQRLVRHDNLVGSHLLAPDCATDVVGNAAALDVNKFLTLRCEDKTLLQWMQDEKQAVIDALANEAAEAWVDAFLDFIREPETFATHTLAKQIYWLEGSDPACDEHFVLLAPLYPSSLAHAIYTEIQEDRFGEAAKTARKARKENIYCEQPLHEYPDLAVQKLGGTKPQNISQLNSERSGTNYLFSSCPPPWRSRQIRPVFYQESALSAFANRPAIQERLTNLRLFLESDPAPILATRKKRDAYVLTIIGELRQYVEELLSLAPGWTSDRRCRLADEERCWLDPFATATDPDFSELWTDLNWAPAIERRFANWLNRQLGQDLPLGDTEHRHWVDLFDYHVWRQALKKFKKKEAEHA